MNQLNKIVLSLCMVLLSAIGVQAQCEVDTSLPDTLAIYPDSLPMGVVGEPYEQVINIVFVNDTTVSIPNFGDVTANLCSFTLDSIPNLPGGLSYECNVPDCKWDMAFVPEDTVNQGCVVLSGTPVSAVFPGDSLQIFLTIDAGLYNPTSGECEALPIQLPPELLDQFTKISVRVPFTIMSTTPIDTYIEKDFAVLLAPNPSVEGSILKYQLPEQAKVQVTVTDMIGRQLHVMNSGLQASGQHEVALPTKGLTPGVYLVTLNLDAGKQVISRKLVIN